jgi:hypothetical protein
LVAASGANQQVAVEHADAQLAASSRVQAGARPAEARLIDSESSHTPKEHSAGHHSTQNQDKRENQAGDHGHSGLSLGTAQHMHVAVPASQLAWPSGSHA